LVRQQRERRDAASTFVGLADQFGIFGRGVEKNCPKKLAFFAS